MLWVGPRATIRIIPENGGSMNHMSKATCRLVWLLLAGSPAVASAQSGYADLLDLLP